MPKKPIQQKSTKAKSLKENNNKKLSTKINSKKAEEQITEELILYPENNKRLVILCGYCNDNLHYIEKHLNVKLHNRGNIFRIVGKELAVKLAKQVLQLLFAETEYNKNITLAEVHLHIRNVAASDIEDLNEPPQPAVTPVSNQEINYNTTDHPKNDKENVKSSSYAISIKTPKLTITPRGKNQTIYVKNILQNDINFSVGPAGTGKTYLAVACAIAALQNETVERIVLVRPVVEAGEHLGFLPGDISQKIDPYLRPLYDALYDMFGAKQVEKLLAEHIIEIAPLAFMRGRTLNASFIILDESQNTTQEQMQMFLTRIGFGSKAVITGDITQVDLAKGKQSGLIHALKILQNIEGICFNYFDAQDVVRHPLVQRVIQAYASHKAETEREKHVKSDY